MKRFILRRVFQLIPTTVGVLILTFLLFHVVAGSPAEIVLGKNATAEALADFDARHGYDKPLLLGRWTAIRAVGRATVPFDSGSGDKRVQVPMTYALPAGTYRLNAGQLLIHLQEDATGVTDDVMLDGPAPLDFTIRDGWKAVSLQASKVTGKVFALQKKNSHWLDSHFFNYCWDLLRGNLGFSTEYQQPVATVLRQGVGPSLSLTVPILLGGTILGVMLGLLCAAWRGGVADRLVLLVSTVLMSVNYVVWVLAGQFILAFKLKLFPLWGFESAFYLVLPVMIGILSGLGRDIRFYRAAILDEIYKPYVRTAQAKGLSRGRILFGHVLRNSMIPIVTYISLSIPFLFTGSLMLESFFGIPGLGSVSLNAIHASDMAVVRAVVVLGALFYQVVNLFTDLCYAWLDPRVRLK
jgi:peptide/nickel transport system permease protein